MLPLHNHSEYSALDGYSRPAEIATALVGNSLPGAFITDHGTVAGWRAFKKALDAEKLWSGFGVEAYQAKEHRLGRPEGKNTRDSAHLILLAKNWTGAQNIMRMTDEANRTGFYYNPRVDWELLEKYSEGIIATSACFSGLVPRAIRASDKLHSLDRYLKIFGDDFFIELSTYGDLDGEQHELNTTLAAIAKERGIGMVYANDAHYANKEDHAYHQAMLCMQTASSMDKPTMSFVNDLWIMDEDSVRQHLDHLPQHVIDEAIDNSDLIMEMCKDFRFPDVELHLPIYEPKDVEKKKNIERFAEACEEGMERLGLDGEEYWERLEEEFDVLTEAGLADYFLITAEYCNWADEQGIARGPGRGSVGGSLIAYCMGITDIDPIKYGLYFSRFYNAGRSEGLPDIDIDFSQIRRGEIIEHLRSIYGEFNVVPIGTHIRMKPKAVIDKLVKPLYGGNWVDAFAREMPKLDLEGLDDDEADAVIEAAMEVVVQTMKDRHCPDAELVAGEWLEEYQNDDYRAPDLFSANYAEIKQIKEIIESVPDIEILSADLIAWHADDGIICSVMDEFVLGRDGGYVLDENGERLRRETPQARELAPFIKKYPDLFNYAYEIGGRISTYGVHASAVVLADIDLRTPLPGMNRAAADAESSERVIATQVEMREVEALGFPKFDLLGLRTLDTLEEVAPLSEFQAINWDDMPAEMWHLMDKGQTLGFFQVEKGMARHIGKKLRPRDMLDLSNIVALNRPGPLRTGASDKFLLRRAGEEDVTYDHPILEPLLNWTYGIFLYQEQVIGYARAIGYTEHEADDIRSMLGKKKVAAMVAEHPRYMEYATQHMDTATAQKIWDGIVDFSKYSFNLAHSVGYGILLGRCLYAKWKYPTKFIMACIHTNSKRAGEYVAEGRRLGVHIEPPNINESDVFVQQKGDTIYYGLADVKGVGTAAAQWIIDHRPYRDAEHYNEIMDEATAEHKALPKEARPPRSPRQICTAGALTALYNAGAFDTLEDRDLPVKAKAKLQQDLLGVVLLDDIDDIIKNNTDKLDQCYSLGDVDLPENRDEKMKVAGVIQEIKPIKSKNGNAMGFVRVEWEGEEAEICVSPKHWDDYQFLLKPRVVAIWSVTPQERGLSFNGATKLSGTEE